MSNLLTRRYRERLRLARKLEREGRRLWRQVTADNLNSWDRHAPQLLVALLGAQSVAASDADDYVDSVLRLQGRTPIAAGTVNPSRLTGVASDGRTLDTLLRSPVVATRLALRTGTTMTRAMATGQATLRMVLHTQVADAGRVADGVAIAARPGAGWVRMLNPPSCSRCVALAGRFYRYNAGFLRHPNCNCLHVPAYSEAGAQAEGLVSDPMEYFRSLSEAEQDRVFTNAGAQAIRDGADLSQVVNARRGANGLSLASDLPGGSRRSLQRSDLFGQQVFVTSEGVTKRGVAGRTLGPERRKFGRLMPESIYELATSRDDAIRLLRSHGYLI